MFLAGALGRFHPVPHRQRRPLLFLAQVQGPVRAVLEPREVGGSFVFSIKKKALPHSCTAFCSLTITVVGSVDRT